MPISKVDLSLRSAGPTQPLAAQGAASTAVIEDLGHFSALSQNGHAPPDTQVGVSQTRVVEMVNTAAAIYDKSGTQLSTFDLGQFYAGTAGQGTDPRILYDAESGFFIAAYELLPAGGDEIDIAVTTNPAGTWTAYAVSTNTSNTLFDQPKLGVNSDKITVSWNDYDNTKNPQPFTGTETWVIQKSQVLAGATANAIQFGPDTGKFQIVPVQSMSATTTEYAAAHYAGSSDVHIFSITGTPSANNVSMNDSSIGVGSVSGPPLAAQPSGGDANIATNDDRVTHAVWRNNSMWAVFNEVCTPTGDTSNRACLRFVEASTSGGISGTDNVQLGYVGGDIYYGAVMLDPGMDLYGGFTASSASLFPTAVAMGVPNGTFPAVTIGAFYQSGSQAYVCGCGNDTAGNPNFRWGDYSGVALDPSNTNDVWTAQEFGGLGSPNAGFWGTSIGRFTLYPPTVTGISPSTGPANPADASCNPTVTISGSEFVSGGTTVKFGIVSSSTVNVTAPDRLTAVAPSQGPGSVDIRATTQNGTSAVNGADVFTYVADTTAPTPTGSALPAPNAAGWNKSNVTVTMSGTDNVCGTGVGSITYSTTGAQAIASTSVAADSTQVVISTEGITTVTWYPTDRAGNVGASSSATIKLDKTAPSISIGAPAATDYLLNQAVAAAYSCSDPIVSGVVVSCVGTVPTGSNIDTSTLGNHTFTVNATDIADNSSSSSVTYNVTYKILLLYDPLRPPKGGNSTIAIKLQIADANNVNLSSPSIGLVATGIKTAGGTTVRSISIPFRYDATLPGYIVNISTKGLVAGDYNLTFTVAGDSRVHLAPFRLR